MKGLLRLAAVLGLLALAGFLAFRLLFGGASVNWHQRLTVTVVTPAGEVSGSSVTAVTLRDYTTGTLVLPDARRLQGEVSGEAVVIEVAPGRYLFALLGGAGHWAYAAFGLDGKTSYVASMRRLKAQPVETPAPLPPEAYPLLVTFDDISDPKTVRQVDPADLAASFGPGVSLKGVMLAVTDEPVVPWRSGQVAKILPQAFFEAWGAIHKEALARGFHDPYFDSLLGQLSRSNFQMGER